jgi:HK97 family phage portal protein
MGWLSRLAFWRSERKGLTLDQIRAAYRGTKGYAGIPVDEAIALQTATVAACVALVANDVAAMPLKVKRKVGERETDATDSRLYDLLFRRPNPLHTALEFRQMLTAQAMLHGDGIALKQKDGAGRVSRLWPLRRSEYSVRRDGTRIEYTIAAYDGEFSGVYESRDVLHIRGINWDGVNGLSRVWTAGEAIGVAAAAERSQARSFGNGGRMPGYWTTDSPLGDDDLLRMAEQLRAANTGENQWKSPLLDNGLKYQTVGQDFETAQMIETRRHQMIEICAHFGVVPAVLGIDDKTQAFASVEAMMRWHLQHTLRPWLTAWEQALDRDVLDTAAGPLFAKFDTSDLEKASTKERAESYRSLVELGVMTRNEARRLEGLPPLAGLDMPLTPANMNGGVDEDPAA